MLEIIDKQLLELEDKKRDQVVSIETLMQLDEKGYCAWRCALLGGEIILVVRNNLSENVELPPYPVYTVEELARLAELDVATLRLIHQAKKAGGARLLSIEERRNESK